MCEADFAGIDAGEYYANLDFHERERRLGWEGRSVKNRTTVKHGMLSDLKQYLTQSGWKIEQPVGQYEVLRARLPGRERPLLVHIRDRGCGFSIDERDEKIYRGWQRNRRRRGIDPYSPTEEEQENERSAIWRGERPWEEK